MNTGTKIAYVVVILSSLFGSYHMIINLDGADTIFQQIAAMTEGLCFVIIPYCIARAVEKITAGPNTVIVERVQPQETVYVSDSSQSE
jgi:hypothetical protein